MEKNEDQSNNPSPRPYRTRKAEVVSGITLVALIPIVSGLFAGYEKLDAIKDRLEQRNNDQIKITKEYLDLRIKESNDNLKDEMRELRTDLRELRTLILKTYGGGKR